MKRFAYLFPGQGAQFIGMGQDFYKEFTEAKDVFNEADELLGSSLTKLIFDGDLEELTQTKNSQPAIFVCSMAILRVIEKQFPSIKPSACAGLSLGEYTAVCASDAASFSKLLPVVAQRGAFMQEAATAQKGAMAAVIGINKQQLFDFAEKARQNGVQIWVANLNSPVQQVLAGTTEAIEQVKEEILSLGAKKYIPLSVSGAFHSGLMEPAQKKLAPVLDQLILKKPEIKLALNATGSFVSDVSELRKSLKRQVVDTMRWEEDVQCIEAEGMDQYIEIGPGTVLAGLNKRIKVKAPTLSIQKVEDLEKLAKEV